MMTRWAPGITFAAISRDGGASATHGELSSKSKYTAPVRRTARSTSERTSAFTPTLRAPDARASAPDREAGLGHWQTNGKTNRTFAHGSDVRSHRSVGDLPGNEAPADIERISL